MSRGSGKPRSATARVPACVPPRDRHPTPCCQKHWPWRAEQTTRRPARAPHRARTNRRWPAHSGERRSRRASCPRRIPDCRGRPRTSLPRTVHCPRTSTSRPGVAASSSLTLRAGFRRCSGLKNLPLPGCTDRRTATCPGACTKAAGRTKLHRGFTLTPLPCGTRSIDAPLLASRKLSGWRQLSSVRRYASMLPHQASRRSVPLAMVAACAAWPSPARWARWCRCDGGARVRRCDGTKHGIVMTVACWQLARPGRSVARARRAGSIARCVP